MDDVIADHVAHKKWGCIVTVHALGVIHVPLRPTLHAGCAAIAGRSLRGLVSRLQSRTIVGIASPIIAEPNDPNVTIGVGRDPGEEVGMAPIYGQAHTNWVRPGRPLVGREGVEDVGVVRPDRVDEPEVIRGKGWEKIHRALILRTGRAGEDLSIGEGEGGQTQLCVGRDSDVDATRRATRKVFRYAVRSHKHLVEVAAARAAAAVRLDLPGDVSAIGRRYAARSGESLGVNSLAESS